MAQGIFRNHQEIYRELWQQEPCRKGLLPQRTIIIEETDETKTVQALLNSPQTHSDAAVKPQDVDSTQVLDDGTSDMFWEDIDNTFVSTEIDVMEHRYSEDSHSIETLSAKTPLRLYRVFGKEEVGSKKQRRAIVVQETLDGKRIGYMLSKIEYIRDIDDLGENAVIEQTTKTICAFGEKGEAFDVPDAIAFARYRVGANGRLCEDKVEIQQGDYAIVNTSYSNGLSRFPEGPVNLNEEYSFVLDAPEDAPQVVRDSPPVLKGRILKFVRFDGKEAVLIEAEEMAYEATRVTTGGIEKLIISKVKMKGRFYISTENGEILWGETVTEIVDSDRRSAIGIVSSYREELIDEAR